MTKRSEAAAAVVVAVVVAVDVDVDGDVAAAVALDRPFVELKPSSVSLTILFFSRFSIS